MTVLVGVGAYFVASRGFWLFSDEWTYLLRNASSPRDLLTPHAGHLVPWQILSTNALHRVFGLEHWPGWHLFRAVTYGAMLLVLWAHLRWRGTGRRVAFSVVVLLLVWPSQVWIQPYTAFNPVVIAGLLVLCRLLPGVDGRDRRQAFLLAVLALMLVTLGGLGVAVVVAGVVTAVAGRRRWAATAMLPALAAYLTWYALADGTEGADGLALERLGDAVPAVLQLLELAGLRLFGLPVGFGPLLAVGVLAAVAVVLLQDRVPLPDQLLLVTAAGYVALLLWVRVFSANAGVDEVRYSANLTLLLLPLLVPRLRLPAGPRVTVVAGALLLVVSVHQVVELRERHGDWSRTLTDSRELVGAAAWLAVEHGEVFIEGAPADGNRTGFLTIDDLFPLVRAGWEPGPPADDRYEARGRGELRLAYSPRDTVLGVVPEWATRIEEADCVAVAAGEAVVVPVGRRAGVRLSAGTGRAELRLETETGPALRSMEVRSRPAHVEVLGDEPGSQLVVTHEGPGIEACAVPLASFTRSTDSS